MGKASRKKKVREAPGRASKAKPLPVLRVELAAGTTPAWLHAVAALTLVGLAGLIYYPALSGEFVFDDNNAIQQSLLVRKILPLARFLTHSNRPLVDFTYALNYAQGGYDTWWFHFTNIAIHALAALLVYALAVRTLRLPSLTARYGPWSQPIAWTVAAIFVSHPLATESVAYISSRYESQAGLFYLLTMLICSVAVTSPNNSTRKWARYSIPVTTALALACKEIAATIPLALLLYDYIFVAAGDRRATRTRLGTIGLSLIPLLLGGAYLVLRAFASGTFNTPYKQSAGFGFERYTPLQFLATEVGVILHYLRLCFVPTGLTFDYDWPLRSPFELAAIVPMMVLIGLVVLAVRTIKSQPLFSFALLFTLLVLAPTSSIMPLADLAVERRMYIPLAGFSLFAAGLLADLARRALGSNGLSALAIVGLIVVAGASFRSQARAVLWGDHLLLYEDAVKKAPGSPRVRLNLGVIHMNAGRHDEAHRVLFEAKELFDKGISIHAFPRIGAFIYYNLGAIQFIRHDYDDAEKYMAKSIEVGGQYVALRPRAYAVLAQIYRNRGDNQKAIAAFREALKYNHDYPEWTYALADALVSEGEYEEARQLLFQIHRLHPEDVGSEESVDLQQRIIEGNRQRRRKERAEHARREREQERARAANDSE